MSLRTEVPPVRCAEMLRLVQFAFVGVVGFLVNLGTVSLLRILLGIHAAGALAFVAAATTTWIGNRLWTFRDAAGAPTCRQWALFLVANLGGFAIYYGTFEATLGIVPAASAHPALAVIAGSLAGLGVNFTLSRQLVFR